MCAGVLGDTVFSEFPFVEGGRPMASDNFELLLNKTWKPTISYTGSAPAACSYLALSFHVPSIPL